MNERGAEAAFRAEVAAWFAEHAPAKGGAGDFSSIHIVSAMTPEQFEASEAHALDITRSWQRTLHASGWAGRSWPVEYGGHAAPLWQTQAIADEQTQFGVSTKMLAVALEMVPPVLLEHGTHDQRLAHLPRIVRGDEAWCQLLSEPDAGSDLTNVQTLATPVTGGWTVSGQKVWTSGAASADYALLLARTDRSVPGRGGVSFFALDMRPGRSDRSAAPADVGRLPLQRGLPRRCVRVRGCADRFARRWLRGAAHDVGQRASCDRGRHQCPIGDPAPGHGRRERADPTTQPCARSWPGPTRGSGCSTR